MKEEIDKKTIKYKNITSIISLGLLFLATFKVELDIDLPYGYYTFLRWVVTLSTIFLVWTAYNSRKTFWFFSMAIVAILFNPITPVYLDEETWMMIDFVVAILFLLSIFKIKGR